MAPTRPLNQVYKNDLCSRPRRARPDTVLTRRARFFFFITLKPGATPGRTTQRFASKVFRGANSILLPCGLFSFNVFPSRTRVVQIQGFDFRQILNV